MNPLSSPLPGTVPLSRSTRPLGEVRPEAFLAACQGLPRGFWGRGERWVAWAGILREVAVGSEPGAGGFPGAATRVREALEGLTWHGEGGEPAPRFFGGFRFSPPREASPTGGEEGIQGDASEGVDSAVHRAWEGFPAARFILPRFLLERDEEGTRLVLHQVEGEDGRHHAFLDELAVTLARGTRLPAPPQGLAPDPRWDAPGSPPVGPPSRNGDHPDGDAPARRAWARSVEQVLTAIRRGSLEKAVLARIQDLEARVELPSVLARLREENGRAHVYLFEPEPGRVLLGAAPEILAELREGRFHATAVAGSISRGDGPAADRALAARLRASRKDLAEHRHTVEVMREALLPLMEELRVAEEPGVLTLARIQHLETEFRGRALEGVDVLSLVEALHPTPAVCGRPRGDALAWIHRSEPFDRGWYAAPVGWVDGAGNGDFVPALRSAVGQGDRWRLFAGAGIVEGSHPESEWEETGLKFEPALRALGMDPT